MADHIEIVTSPSELPESQPTVSHVKRIILEFEDNCFLPLPAPQFRDGGLYDGQKHVLSVKSRMVPTQEGTKSSDDTTDPGDSDLDSDDVDENELPEDMKTKKLERHKSLEFECRWWCEEDNTPAEPIKPSFKQRVKKFFQSMICCSRLRILSYQ